jgi:hypothetical protein
MLPGKSLREDTQELIVNAFKNLMHVRWINKDTTEIQTGGKLKGADAPFVQPVSFILWR